MIETNINKQEEFFSFVMVLLKQLTIASLQKNVFRMRDFYKELYTLTKPYLGDIKWYEAQRKEVNCLLNPVSAYVIQTPEGVKTLKGFSKQMGYDISRAGSIIDMVREKTLQDLHDSGLLSFKNKSKQQIMD